MKVFIVYYKSQFYGAFSCHVNIDLRSGRFSVVGFRNRNTSQLNALQIWLSNLMFFLWLFVSTVYNVRSFYLVFIVSLSVRIYFIYCGRAAFLTNKRTYNPIDQQFATIDGRQITNCDVDSMYVTATQKTLLLVNRYRYVSRCIYHHAPAKAICCCRANGGRHGNKLQRLFNIVGTARRYRLLADIVMRRGDDRFSSASPRKPR